MGRFRVYIKPFDDAGDYESSWTEVTEDVDSSGLGAIKQTLDNTEYDVGILKNANLQITLVNISGRYSDVGTAGSIFKFRRSASQVRITWEIMPLGLVCGFFTCGNAYISEEITIFEGLLDDQALKQEVDDQNLTFSVLGKESILDEVECPFASLSAGDTFETIIFDCLNQTRITELLTVDASNIECSVDSVTDAIADLENKTVKEVLELILLYSNSVLYVVDNVIYVKPRTATVDVKKTFYGQGARDGLENIIDISDYRSGLNRVFNFWTWQDTDLVSSDATSLQRYGVRKKEIKTTLITDNTKRGVILASLKDEFRNPKIELLLRVPIDYATIALKVLDRIAIDYPNVAIPSSGDIPLWDLAVWDSAVYPLETLPISIDASTNFKILSKDIDTSNHELVFYVREI